MKIRFASTLSTKKIRNDVRADEVWFLEQIIVAGTRFKVPFLRARHSPPMEGKSRPGPLGPVFYLFSFSVSPTGDEMGWPIAGHGYIGIYRSLTHHLWKNEKHIFRQGQRLKDYKECQVL